MSSIDALSINRRTFLNQSAYGLGGMALSMLAGNAHAAKDLALPDHWDGSLKSAHYPVKAKRVIFLCMAGGPSQFETFDNKPKLRELHDQPFPESFTKGQQLAQLQGAELKARGPFTEFKKWGQSGIEVSELFPHIGGIADDLCVIRSMPLKRSVYTAPSTPGSATRSTSRS